MKLFKINKHRLIAAKNGIQDASFVLFGTCQNKALTTNQYMYIGSIKTQVGFHGIIIINLFSRTMFL